MVCIFFQKEVTPLYLAVENGHLDVVKLLYEVMLTFTV